MLKIGSAPSLGSAMLGTATGVHPSLPRSPLARDRLAAPIPLPWLEPPLGVAMRHRGVHPTPTPSSLVCAARSQHEALGALSLHQRGLLLFQGDGDMRCYSPGRAPSCSRYTFPADWFWELAR
jgi:hypothetical protein